MSPTAGTMLVEEILPIITANVPRGVRRTGSEDAEELVQDTLCSAAQMLDSAERSGVPLYPSSIAYYSIQRSKTGRRSTSAGRMDAMCPAAQLDRAVSLTSMDAEIEENATGEETVSMHELLAAQTEDPAQTAARELDWSELLQQLDERQIEILTLTAQGGRLEKLAFKYGVSNARVCQLRRRLGQRVQHLWGATALQDATREASWKRNNLHTAGEKAACRRERWLASAM